MIEMDDLLIRKLVKRGKRLDGRNFDAYREVSIETNFINSAEGSARLRLGNTEVVVGVKMGIGTPYPDTPDEGVLVVNAELVPLASPEFEKGPPGEESIELARVVDRAIRESKCIAFDKLCIEPGKAVWMVNVDIDVLDDDGNLIDASCMAAVAALATAKMPEYEKNDDSYKVNFDKKSESLPMKCLPISTTFVRIGDAILADPALDELNAMDARLTIGTLDDGKEIKLCSMQKGGSNGLAVGQVEQIIDLAIEKGKELRKIVKAEKE
ncbi:MAG: exosome complex protein Rrp42 [Candidatus Aenigmarchaeota archaeon]|nr:exosome complex protein Rrp42 [Candidatus Aenigmarchaeota archaeon]